MIRLVLLALLLLAAIVAFRKWGRGAARSRREGLVRELRGAFLHRTLPDRPHRSAALTSHNWGRLEFRLPAPWSLERNGDALEFRVGAAGDLALRVLRVCEEGPADPAASSSELLAGGSELLRWLEESRERVRYGWRLRSANGRQAVTFLFEPMLGEAGETFRQADVASIDRAVREARFEPEH